MIKMDINLDVKSLYGYGTGRTPDDQHVVVSNDVFTLYGQSDPNSYICILKSYKNSDYEYMDTLATDASGNFSFDYSKKKKSMKN